MEIERKYLIIHIPFDIAGYPFHQIEQAYLSTAPVVRVRQEDDTYYLTYKSKGLMAREEYNLPLTKESYEHLRSKADGRILTKKRYLIPMEGTEYTIELDIFLGEYEGLKLAEVEFPSEEAALAFVPPEWFGREVTFTGEYQNSRLALAENLVLKTKEKKRKNKNERTIQRYIINDKTSNELDQNAPLLSGRTLYAGVSVRIFSAGAA